MKALLPPGNSEFEEEAHLHTKWQVMINTQAS